MSLVQLPVAARPVHGRRKLLAITAAGSLLVAACGGGDEPSSTGTATTVEAPETTAAPTTDPTASTTPEPVATSTAPPASTASTEPANGSVIITSEDGNLTLEVDAADAERVNPTVRILDPSEWPPELGDADQLPGVTIYEMGPDGAQFDEPVVVTRRLDAASFGDSLDAGAVPLVVPFTQNDDGSFVPLDDLEVTRIGTDIFASGSTMHFSPLGTIDLQMDVHMNIQLIEVAPTSLPTFGPVDFQPFSDRFPDASFATIPEAMAVDVASVAGTMPDVVSRAAVPPSTLPGFGPVETNEVARTSPTQTAEEDARSLYSLLASSDDVPSSPLFGGPEAPAALKIAAVQYITAVEDGADQGEADRLRKIADDIAAGAFLEFRVIHTPLGSFPSFVRIRVYKTPELANERLLAALYTGEFGPEAQLVDIAEMEPGNGEFTADTGLTSFGDVNHALIIVPDDPSTADKTPLEIYDDLMSLPGDLMALFVPDPFPVDANEGVLFDGDPGYQILDRPWG